MKKLTATILLMILLFNSTFAQSFNDLDKAEWAEAYIVKLADMGIVVGDSIGNYNPLDDVSHYAALLVIYRSLESKGLIDKADVGVYVNRYQIAIAAAEVPNWPDLHSAVAYALEKQMISERALNQFNSRQDGFVSATRQDMAVYLGRAIAQYLPADEAVEVRPFIDDEHIAESAKSYVYQLASHDIISGDLQNYFKPTEMLSRAALAKLMVASLDELEAAEKVVYNDIHATVKVKLDETRQVVFYKENSTTESYVEKVSDDVLITIDGRAATYRDLALDQRVVLHYVNDKLVEVEGQAAPPKPSSMTGTVSDVVSFNGRRLLYIDNQITSSTELYELNDDTAILSGDANIAFSEIKAGDIVTINVSDKVINNIQIIGKSERVAVHTVGKIADFKRDLAVLTLQNEANYSINLSKDTLIIDVNGQLIDRAGLAINQKVFIYGMRQGQVYSADKVLILEE